MILSRAIKATFLVIVFYVSYVVELVLLSDLFYGFINIKIFFLALLSAELALIIGKVISHPMAQDEMFVDFPILVSLSLLAICVFGGEGIEIFRMFLVFLGVIVGAVIFAAAVDR